MPRADDLPPTGEEAKSQRVQSITPLIWSVIGLAAIAIFVVFLLLDRGAGVEPSAAVVAPAERPAPH
jgi:hypothetical protein